MAKKLSKKDSTELLKANVQVDELVETLTNLVGADDGLLHLLALEMQSSALAIQEKLRLIRTVSNASSE